VTLVSRLGLAAAMFLLAITRGPGVFATVSKALASGFRHAVPVVAGIVVGDLVFLLFAIYGLAVIAETFSLMFTAVKYFGGVYLTWLGIRLWRSTPASLEIAESISQSKRFSFFGGLSITLGNPKVILFYLGFLPTFLDLQSLTNLDIAVVAFVVSVVLGAVMLLYAFMASRARELLKSERAQNRMNRTAGSVMIGTGAALLTRA
jgi:threonine/homoserine/homoserine lactone efflux protein